MIHLPLYFVVAHPCQMVVVPCAHHDEGDRKMEVVPSWGDEAHEVDHDENQEDPLMVALEREVPYEEGTTLEEVPLMDEVPGEVLFVSEALEEVPFVSEALEEVPLVVNENLGEVLSEMDAVPVVGQ